MFSLVVLAAVAISHLRTAVAISHLRTAVAGSSFLRHLFQKGISMSFVPIKLLA